MHMSDALISPAVAGTMTVVSFGTIAFVVSKLREKLTSRDVSLMGILGAFTFAAQMINFTIPFTGSSGHIVGAILLSAILGPLRAFLVMVSVLIIQALFFADGGIMALGCNIFTMGILPCLLIYTVFYKAIVKRKVSAKTITLASIISSILALELSAASVSVMTTLSGITALPLATFLITMTSIHLPISIVEGIVTGAILSYIFEKRSDLLEAKNNNSSDDNEYVKPRPLRPVIISFLIASLLIGGGFSIFASKNPDGLEWSINKVSAGKELRENKSIWQNIQNKLSFMPDYGYKSEDISDNVKSTETTTAGIVGSSITLAVAFIIGMIIKQRRKLVSKDVMR